MQIDNMVVQNMRPERLDTVETGRGGGLSQPTGTDTRIRDLILLGTRDQLVELTLKSSSPDGYEVRMANLRHLVKSGSYQPDAGRISEAMVQEALDQS